MILHSVKSLVPMRRNIVSSIMFGMITLMSIQTHNFSSPDPITLQEINAYLDAMEGFDLKTNATVTSSCRTLSAAIQALLRTVDTRRYDQMSAILYALLHIRRDKFPDLQYRVVCRDKQTVRHGMVDILAQRADGTLFSLLGWLPPSYFRVILEPVEERNASGRFFSNVERPVSHTIFVSLRFIKRKRRMIGQGMHCLGDTYDPNNGVAVDWK